VKARAASGRAIFGDIPREERSDYFQEDIGYFYKSTAAIGGYAAQTLAFKVVLATQVTTQ
jgi:hypothetical protein